MHRDRSDDPARRPRTASRRGAPPPAAFSPGTARALVHACLSAPRLSADLGRPDRRSGGAAGLQPTDRVIAIASGGCNVLSYLTADPAEIVAVDLNGAHIALNKLKICALRELPDHAAFFDFFGRADRRENHRALRSDAAAPAASTRRRAPIGTGAALTGGAASTPSRAISIATGCSGVSSAPAMPSPGSMASGSTRCWPRDTLDEQRAAFEREIAPLFEKRFVRWLARRPAALYGLGIPPAQYQRARRRRAGRHRRGAEAPGRAARLRLSRSRDNYFAWQAFGRALCARRRSEPAALSAARAISTTVRARADRVQPHHGSLHRAARGRSRRRASTPMSCSTRRTG